MTTRGIYEIGEMPPIGEVPRQMYAQVIRQDRFGVPRNAFKVERVDVPKPARGEVLLYVMAAGVNYNGVWAALGSPVDVIAQRQREGDPSNFHIAGSDAAGIVYAVGEGVTNLRVGDQVVTHPGQWNSEDPFIKAGGDPITAPSARIWGYETSWGSFAQFAKVQAHQCMPKAKHLTWEEAAVPSLTGTTAYRMLTGWPPHTVQKGDVVFVWGGDGGLGTFAIQIVKMMGGIPIASIPSDDRAQYCIDLGAKGCVNFRKFDHWGIMPHWKDTEAYNKWAQGARAFGRAIWDALGERRSPRIVFEHVGEVTVPTSIFICDNAGMVVICAGTTGYNAVADLRYLWMRQKRFQGSHAANDEQARGFNQLVVDGKIKPCLAQLFPFDQTGEAHQTMHEGRHLPGKMGVLVGAPRTGLKDIP
ncbi:MAG: ccrA [Dehalococcoidia bacterium]|nr:ccrA [Dehalococcoidia bacterium]